MKSWIKIATGLVGSALLTVFAGCNGAASQTQKTTNAAVTILTNSVEDDEWDDATAAEYIAPIQDDEEINIPLDEELYYIRKDLLK